jgi:hypothetical protein
MVDVLMWRRKICEGLDGVIDEKFQRDAWFGKSKYISSPDEEYNMIFSDFGVEEFIASPEVALHASQKMAGNQLVEKMRYFAKLIGPGMPPDKVIDHAVWAEVRQAAKRFSDLLECKKCDGTQQ